MTFKAIKWKAVNAYDTMEESDACAIKDFGPSLTVQSHSEDADINVIVRRYGLTGQMPQNPRVPVYGDFDGISDYGSALRAVREADEAFMELPPEVRARFENDPQKLLAFVEDDANIAEAVKLGLMRRDFDAKTLSVTSVAGVQHSTPIPEGSPAKAPS